eukprot:5179-Heterococcus_DN1.PRE.3
MQPLFQKHVGTTMLACPSSNGCCSDECNANAACLLLESQQQQQQSKTKKFTYGKACIGNTKAARALYVIVLNVVS